VIVSRTAASAALASVGAAVVRAAIGSTCGTPLVSMAGSSKWPRPAAAKPMAAATSIHGTIRRFMDV